MQTYSLSRDGWGEVVALLAAALVGGAGEDKWAFQGMTQRPVKSLLSQTLINHRSRSN